MICASCSSKQSRDQTLTPQDLMIREDASLVSPALLSAAEVQEDIALLIYALKNGYGGRKYVPQKVFEDALAGLEKINSSMSPGELRDRVDAILWTIPDSHLKARLNGVHAAARMKFLTAGGVNGANAISDPKKIWQVRIDSSQKKKILYVSITSFPSGRDAIWSGFIDAVKKHLKESSLMVLDLRGNGGGDDEYGYHLAELLFGGKINDPVTREYFSQTPETFMISANGARMRDLYLKSHGQPVPDYLAKLHSEAMEKYRMAIAGTLPPERIADEGQVIHKFDPKKGYTKPIFILLDGGCASSCESTIGAFETNPMVKRVGSNSIGMIHFGNEGAVLLPHSKIHITMATKYNEYGDKRFIEKTGIKPDIEVPAGQDAYTFLKARI